MYLLVNPDMGFRDLYALVFLGTAFICLVAPHIGTLIIEISNGVFVIIVVGTAVVIFKTIGVFRFRDTFVTFVHHPVQVVVFVGTTIIVEIAVLIFGIDNAVIDTVQNAVTVHILILRTAIIILESIEILGLLWAQVHIVTDAVHIPVQTIRHDHGRSRALICRRLLVGQLRILYRYVEMVFRPTLTTLINFKLGKSQMRLGQGQLFRSANIGAVAFDLLNRFPRGENSPPELCRGGATETQSDNNGENNETAG